MNDYLGKDMFKLGFGLMRLPRLLEGGIDVEQVKTMVDMFLQAGGTYFDTAYAYAGSEEAIREALVKRYPRESYTLATKLNAWISGCDSEESAKRQFDTSLERTGAGYFDYYLLHALQITTYKIYDEYHLWDFVKELKEKGLVKHWGFSFHATPDILELILTEHPDVDFVQLQINYADWENAKAASRANYEVARKHGKPIVVMEPVKGGALADPPAEVKELLTQANPGASVPSWAIRYVASLDGILTVLSGMSNVEQMEDNLSYMKDFKPLDEQEMTVIKKAQKMIEAIRSVPCTSCHYCAPGCPREIPIPNIFTAMNKHLLFSRTQEAVSDYRRHTAGKNKASDCIACGQCEKACPQQIGIIDWLKECVTVLEK